MQSTASRTLRIFTAVFCAVCFLGYCTAVQLAGGSAAGFLWYPVLSAVLIFVPGAQLCTWLLPRVRGTGRIACAYALGIAVLWLSYALFGGLGRFGVPLWLVFAPCLMLAGLRSLFLLRGALQRRATGKHASATATALGQPASAQKSEELQEIPTMRYTAALGSPTVCLLALCVGAGLCVYAFSGVFAFAHAASAGNMQYHQDMMWSVGNGAAVSLGFPLRDLRVAGGVLHYHYLADAVPGFLAWAGGLLPYDAACYYNYPVLLFALVCAAHAAAQAYLCINEAPFSLGHNCPAQHTHGRMYRLAPALFPFALLFLQGFGSDATLNLLRNMNGVAAASLLTCVVLYLLFWAEGHSFSRKAGMGAGFYGAFALALGVLLLSKNLYGILILCALLAAVLVGTVTQSRLRRLWKGPLLLCGIGAVLFGLCWLLLFRFAINNLVQEFWLSPWELVQRLALWLPLGAGLWLLSLAGSVRRFTQLSLSRLTVNAAALGGLLAYVLFHHYSASQVYFLLAAILFMWFCALDALPLLEKACWTRWAAVALTILALTGTALTLLPVGRTGVQVALRCAGLRPAYPYAQDTVTPGDEAAALWLRRQMEQGEVFATNRNAKDSSVGEGTWHYYTAMSGRQAFVESWRYAMDYGMDYTLLRHNLEQVSDVIFAFENAEDAFALAKENGIRWLLVSTPLKPQGFSGARPVYENESVLIYDTGANG